MGVPARELSVDQAGKRVGSTNWNDAGGKRSRRMVTTAVREYHHPYRHIGTPAHRDRSRGRLLVNGLNAELLHPRPDGRSTHTQQFGGTLRTGQHAACLGQGAHDVLPLHFFERREGRCRGGRGRSRPGGLRESGPSHRITARSITLASSLTLPGHSYVVSRARVAFDARRFAHAACELHGEVRRQQRHIRLALAKRRQMDRKDVEAIEQVGSEARRAPLPPSRLRFVAAITRTLTLVGRVLPSRSNSCSCRTRSSFTCTSATARQLRRERSSRCAPTRSGPSSAGPRR